LAASFDPAGDLGGLIRLGLVDLGLHGGLVVGRHLAGDLQLVDVHHHALIGLEFAGEHHGDAVEIAEHVGRAQHAPSRMLADFSQTDLEVPPASGRLRDRVDRGAAAVAGGWQVDVPPQAHVKALGNLLHVEAAAELQIARRRHPNRRAEVAVGAVLER